ncbi:MAG: HAD-IB family phosphatase [Pseudomonadota bacterium]
MSRLIVFDVDSTLLSVESLDFAVERALKRVKDGPERAAELSAITEQGMAGLLDFRASLERRLSIARLTERQVDDAAQALRARITSGMAELLERLRAKRFSLAAVSGGFAELIEPALGELGFTKGDIRANRFVFEAGRASDFDRDNPLSRSGGKGPVLASLKAQLGARSAIMVGDGMTDYEAFEAGAADAFIGFGGVTRREAVARKAPAYAEDVEALGRYLLG